MSMGAGTKTYVATLTGGVGIPGRLGCTMLIVFLNSLPKVGDIQSGPWGFKIWKRGGGSMAGSLDTCGYDRKNSDILFLDSISAAQLLTPAMCSIEMTIS